jgi:hypothetical protein
MQAEISRDMTDPYTWHKRAIAGEKPPIHTTAECGWFLYKSQDGMVPASIFWESPEIDPETGEILADQELRCEIGGVAADPQEMWLWLAKRPISKSEYEQRLAALITGETADLPF